MSENCNSKKDARDTSDRGYSDWVLLLSHLSSWMCTAFLVKLPSLSSFSPRPQRRAASPGQTEDRFDDYELRCCKDQTDVPTFPQQLVRLAHAMLDDALAVV